MWCYWRGYQLALSIPDVSSCLSFCQYGYLFLGLEMLGLFSWIWLATPYKGFIRWGAPKEPVSHQKGSQGPQGKVRRNQGLELLFGGGLPSLGFVSAVLCCVLWEAETHGRFHLWVDSGSQRESWGWDDGSVAQLFIAFERYGSVFLCGQKKELWCGKGTLSSVILHNRSSMF